MGSLFFWNYLIQDAFAEAMGVMILTTDMADIVARIAAERITLVGKLHSIAELVSV